MEKIKTKRKRAKSEKWLIILTLSIPIFAFVMWYIIPNASGFLLAFKNRAGDWTFNNFKRVFTTLSEEDADLTIAFKNTFQIFFISLLIYPIQVLNAFFLYKKVPGARLWTILFLLPGLFMSVAMTRVQQQLLMPNGFLAEWIGEWAGLDYVPELLSDTRFANKILYFLAFWMGFPGNIIIWLGTFSRIPTELLEAGRMDGTNWFTEFTKIAVPLVWPTFCLTGVLMICGIFGSTTSAFLLTRGEYGTMTFSCWMQLQMLSGATSSGSFNFLSAVGLCVTAIAIPLSLFVRKYAGKVFQEVEY